MGLGVRCEHKPLGRAAPEGLVQRSQRLVRLEQRPIGAARGERDLRIGVAGTVAQAHRPRAEGGDLVRGRVRGGDRLLGLGVGLGIGIGQGLG